MSSTPPAPAASAAGSRNVGTIRSPLMVLLLGIITIFVLPAEVGNLFECDAKEKPISGMTGFWMLLPLIGGIVWLFKVQGRLNDF